MNEVKQFAEWIEASKQGIRKQDVKIIKNIPSLILAYKTVVGMQSAVCSNFALTSTCANIGRSICLEFENEDSPESEKSVARVNVGYHCLNILFENKKLAASRNNNSRDPYIVTIKDDDFIDAMLYSINAEPLNIPISTKPTFEAPIPYTKFHHPIAGEMVRKVHPKAIKYFTEENCGGVFDVINRQMAIPYVVNTDLLKVVLECKKDDILSFKDKKLVGDQVTGMKREQTAVLDIAEGVGDEQFWQYMFYDFRGRLYSSLTYFSPQGSKLSKSLFMLSSKKPITREGWTWIMVHTANTWGEDKMDLDDRAKFSEERIGEWMEIASDPVNNKGWQKADDPFNFLAAIMEIKKALDSGDRYNYESGLILAWDATCSGLQVLAALTRDKDAGELCNLTGEERGDYYQMIADSIWPECIYTDDEEITFDYISRDMYALNRAVNKASGRHDRSIAIDIRREYVAEHKDKIIASARVFWGRPQIMKLARNIVKRPCMTYFYSCQTKTMAMSLYDDFKSEPEFKGLQLSYCYWLCHRIYTSCRKKMPIATQMMDMLIDMGKKDYKDGVDFSIIAPHTQFLFMQNYRNPLTKEVKFKYKEKFIKLAVRVGVGGKLDYHKIINATSPNVVHMLDSQIVASVVLNSDYDVVTIHDSFGTCAADAGQLFEDTRKCFVELFDVDLLDEMMIQKEFEGTIQLGDLNIDDVYDNDFTFN